MKGFVKQNKNFYLCSYCLLLNERIAERRQNLVSDNHSKTGIVLHMPTSVHPVLLQTARTELLDAGDASILLPLTLDIIYVQKDSVLSYLSIISFFDFFIFFCLLLS